MTTIAGNIGLATTTRNAGRILALAGRSDIPVVAGAAAPLTRPGIDEIAIHRADGLGGVALPEPAAEPMQGDAAAFIAGLLDREPPGTIDVLALGPLTNIARLAADHPASASRIGRLVVMGGAIDETGNVGPRSEFNLAVDPEAAAIVLAAGLPTTLIPLDVTRRVRSSQGYAAVLAASPDPCAAMSGRLIEAYFQSTANHPGTVVRESRPLHDPCVMLYAARPDLFGCRPMRLAVDVGQGPDAGALTSDAAAPEVQVAMTVDAPAALALLAKGLAG